MGDATNSLGFPVGLVRAEDLRWRELLEDAVRTTGDDDLSARCVALGTEVIRLMDAGHDAHVLIAEWVARLPEAQRVRMAPETDALADALVEVRDRARGPGGMQAVMAYVDEVAPLGAVKRGGETAVMPPLPGARESVTKGRR